MIDIFRYAPLHFAKNVKSTFFLFKKGIEYF